MYEYDSLGISNDYNGFTTSDIALTFTLPVRGEGFASSHISIK
ncbi:hypothetical protein HMPREF3191_00118 [Veillonellaceae bacterium DNF00626]|nr:hypothetical protein HMPREF3191_00118 [Veillonellaceae bacterium DNF00626]